MYPAPPEGPDIERASERGTLRYEDVCQDGRLILTPLPHILATIWRERLTHSAAARAGRTAGIVPILSRMVIDSSGEPIHPSEPVTRSGCFQLASDRGDDGEVSRLFLNMWAELRGVRGRMFGAVEGAGKPVVGGTLFAEHVFTRLFAPPESRKVTRLPAPLPEVPEARHRWRPFEDLLALPEGATAIDDELVTDVAPIVLGLAHSDSNQHVNSLVYPRLFEDAALRRFADLGLGSKLLGRRVEIGYRKPSFAGERLEIALRAFRVGDELGALGVFRAPGSDPRPRCFVRMLFG